MGPEAEVVVLGRAGDGLGVALAAIGTLGIVLAVAYGLVAAVAYPLLLVGGSAYGLVVRYGSVVRLEEHDLVVVQRGREVRYPWADVLEVSWRQDRGGSGPVLRTRGGAYDSPGPNLPEQVAQLPVYGRRAQAAAVAALRAACERHGVRYDGEMERDIALGRRRPRLPSD